MRRTRRSGILIAGLAVSGALLSAPSQGVTAEVDGPVRLMDVSVVASDDVWAVGFHNDAVSTTSVWHWDGTSWVEFDSPSPGSLVNELFSVDAISPTDVWAVGRYADDAAKANTLVEHWDGVSWSVVPSPNSPYQGDQDALVSVSAAGPDDVWAVGEAGYTYQIIEHWNGKRWRLVSTADPKADLRGVSAPAADDAWAVASYPQTIEHWDGVSWTAAGAAPARLTDIAGSSPADVWAVGTSDTAQTLTEHWDGQSWSVVPRARGTRHKDRLYAVSAISATDAWAVGGGTRHFLYTPFAQHWDGTRWTRTPLIMTSSIDVSPAAVDGASANDAWIVGFISYGPSAGPWIEHWDGNHWSPYLP